VIRQRDKFGQEVEETMKTIVGIFDNGRDLEKAIERLARAGFEDTVYDEAIVRGEPAGGGPAVFAPGFAPPGPQGTSTAPELRPKPGQHAQHAIMEAFRAHLAEHGVPAEVIDTYAVTFNHDGEFLLVKTGVERAQQAMQILHACGATRVNSHG
jgi:hypothetical protein